MSLIKYMQLTNRQSMYNLPRWPFHYFRINYRLAQVKPLFVKHTSSFFFLLQLNDGVFCHCPPRLSNLWRIVGKHRRFNRLRPRGRLGRWKHFCTRGWLHRLLFLLVIHPISHFRKQILKIALRGFWRRRGYLFILTFLDYADYHGTNHQQ